MSQLVRNGMSASSLTGVTWRKPTRSGCHGKCVEAAVLIGGEIAIRNSRHPSGPALIFTREEMAMFLAGVKEGEFDDFAS